MGEISRRRLLTTAGAIGALWATSPRAFATALRTTATRAVRTAGTTLDSVATPVGTSGYRRLTAGPGWPLVVRPDLTAPQSGRDDRRTPLASFVQFTDLHLVDAESPVRFEYLHPYIGSAHRPHETLSTQGATSLVRRVNSLPGGPYTGRAFDCLVSTGDNTDNHETAELNWFLSVLNGGTITPNTGNLGNYEGVQNSGSTTYWNPESALADEYKQAGFPQIPGLLSAAIRPFASPGLDTPWYSVFGNHDDSIQGTLPSDFPALKSLYTGGIKLEGCDTEAENAALAAMLIQGKLDLSVIEALLEGPVRIVTADPNRKPFTPTEYMAAHLPASAKGAGPVGHGFTENSVDSGQAYYSFAIAPGVVGISMDSTNRAGFTDGSVGTAQLTWIEQTLRAGSSHYYDSSGKLVSQQVSDTLFVLFSHHTSASMGNTVPDPGNLLEKRHTGPEVVALLQRFPNVVAWVNGHTHRNQITPHLGATPEQGFWEVNTASHTDFPQHARLLEIVDNGDGTISLFTTLIEAGSAYQADYSDTSPDGLASLYRELSFNDIHYSAARTGAAGDHNTELVLTNPLGVTA